MANPWLAHVKKTMKAHPAKSLKQVIKMAKKTYKKTKKVVKRAVTGEKRRKAGKSKRRTAKKTCIAANADVKRRR